MRCPSCQSEVPDDREFCPNCLGELSGAASARPSVEGAAPPEPLAATLFPSEDEQAVDAPAAPPATFFSAGDSELISRFLERSGIKLFGLLCGITGALCGYAGVHLAEEPEWTLLAVLALAGTWAAARYFVGRALEAHDDTRWSTRWVLSGIFSFAVGVALGAGTH